MDLRIPTRITPLPEILQPGPAWTIRHLDRGGHTIKCDRILAAPLDDSPFARGLRAHELTHVRFSPFRMNPKRLRASHMALLAVEDARVNELGGRAGLVEVLRPLDDPAAGHVDPRSNLRIATLLLVAGHGTGAFERLWDAYGRCGDAGARARWIGRQALALVVDAEEPDFCDHTVHAARFLDRALGTAGDDRVPFLCGEAAAEADGAARRGNRRGSARDKGSPPKWGVIQGIDEPPRLIPSAKTAWGFGATDEGAIFRWPHRYALDGRVFARRRRRSGGTVLIDGSGSMGLGRDGVLSLLASAPGAQVVRYDGNADGFGRLRILARGGWRVADELLAKKCCGSGNVIDGPALRRLAVQPGPRVWVTDGQVTGVGDCGHAALRAEATAICAAHGIVQVADAAAARRALAKVR